MRYRSIATEIAICLVLLVFFVEGLLLLFIYDRQTGYLHRQLQAKADEYVVSLSEILSSPLWEYDNEQIRRIGDGYARNKLFTSISIHDISGASLYQFKRNSLSKQIVRNVTINHGGRQIGEARFSLSLRTYRNDLLWFRNTAFLVLTISLMVIVIASGIVFRLLMRKPLAIFYQGMDRVAAGDYDYHFEEVRHTELIDIARRFGIMADKIREREQSLLQEAAERKQAEEKIRESEARIRAILDAFPDILFQFDPSGRCVDMRGAPENLTVSPDQGIGKTLAELMPKNIVSIFQEQLTRAFKTAVMQVFEYNLPIKGQVRHYECRMTPLSDNLALAMVRDITEKVTAAAEKKRLLEQLQRAQKMEAIGILAGGVAHDLNNVLSGLVSYPELILMELPKDSPLQNPIRTIQKSGERAANIVQDLLTMARRGVSVSEIVNLNQVIHDYLKSPEYKILLDYHPDVNITLNLAGDLFNISGSSVHLTKTVMNLISNAAEAITSEGTIRINTENRYIDRPVKGYDDIEAGDYVVLEIRDTGIGMSSEDINRIFEPFYSKKVMGRSGTGLGMAVVWGIVKDHNGYIDIHSTQGKGTTVVLYLPSTKDPRIREVTKGPSTYPLGSGQRILVVDDILEQREIAAEILSKIGYDVESVASGEAAVDYIRKKEADLLILDMIMDPGIDGLETYRQIIDINPGQRAVITSGFSESERVYEARRLGASGYVKKPYRLETLALAVKKALE